MRALGARFGQGLQLVNVLRDLPRDLQLGRCYLPRADLAALGLTPEALRQPSAIGAVRPLLAALGDAARAGLLDGLTYTLTVPRREVQLRLASAWPLLIGLATLARLRTAEDLLDPDRHGQGLAPGVPRAPGAIGRPGLDGPGTPALRTGTRRRPPTALITRPAPKESVHGGSVVRGERQ